MSEIHVSDSHLYSDVWYTAVCVQWCAYYGSAVVVAGNVEAVLKDNGCLASLLSTEYGVCITNYIFVHSTLNTNDIGSNVAVFAIYVYCLVLNNWWI